MSVAIHTDEKSERARRQKYFLPYQVRWLQDESRFKLDEKSRRIGMSYVQSYEDVRDCVKTPRFPVWFSSADESAAREYVLYCEVWAKIFNVAAQSLGEQILDEKDDIKAYVIEFPKTGGRINALRSNPKAFRSKGGKVVLDEFAFHDDQQGLFAAARPSITWGYPIRIHSTHNGKGCLYFRLLDEAKQKLAKGHKTPWSIHTTDIFKAVQEGLADKILRRELTEEERQSWIQEQHDTCLSEEIWQQEFCCIPADEATAFLPYDLIATVEDPFAGVPELYSGGRVFIGVDIGRRRDLFVIWVLELVGDVLWTREVSTLRGKSFAQQDAELERVTEAYPTWERICMDQTGMGEKPVEDAKAKYGDYRVEGVLMTAPVKQELAFGLKRTLEDKRFRAPKDKDVREDFHAVRKVTTVAGNVRFDADRTEQGHADRFWAGALATHAASDTGPPAAVATQEPTPRDWREERESVLVTPDRMGWRQEQSLIFGGRERRR